MALILVSNYFFRLSISHVTEHIHSKTLALCEKDTSVDYVMLYRHCLGDQWFPNVVSKWLSHKNHLRGFWKGKHFRDPYSEILNQVWGITQECTLFRSPPVDSGELIGFRAILLDSGTICMGRRGLKAHISVPPLLFLCL